MRSFWEVQFGLAFLFFPLMMTVADDISDTESEKQTRAKAVMSHIEEIKMEQFIDENRKPLPLIDHALLTFSDPVRSNVHGTVWAWGNEGRPKALVEIYQPTTETVWMHAITQTSTDRIVATMPNRLTWTPQYSDIKFQLVPGAPKTAEREIARLGQLKDTARRFSGHEFWDPENSRYELRLLVQPVHRYRDANNKIIDGAVFLLAHGTNPEIVLLIEAQGESVDSSEWKYGIVRSGSAEMHVEMDGKEVWQRPRTVGVIGKPTDPYWMFWTETKTKLKNQEVKGTGTSP